MKNLYEQKNNKITSMHYIILISIILIILITIFSFNIYATYNNESENQNILDEVDKENQNEENNNESIMQVVLNATENADYIKDLSTELPNDATEDESIAQGQVTPNLGTYTAPNGKTYSTIGNINIPSLGINYPILSSTSTELLNVSINKYWGVNANEVGNMVVLGHNYKDSRFFGKLINIQKGAVVQVTDLSGRTLDYKVYETGIIDPYDTACTSQLTNGHIDVTLITCYYVNGNAHATKRFYAKARAY